MDSNDEILEQVTLLGIYKKEPKETLEDVLEMLVETGMYSEGRDEAIRVFEALRNKALIVGDTLSMTGLIEAKKAEDRFKQ